MKCEKKLFITKMCVLLNMVYMYIKKIYITLESGIYIFTPLKEFFKKAYDCICKFLSQWNRINLYLEKRLIVSKAF